MRKRLTKTERQTVQEFVDALATAFPERIKLMRLFGSRARSQGNEQSDLDLLIVVGELPRPYGRGFLIRRLPNGSLQRREFGRFPPYCSLKYRYS